MELKSIHPQLRRKYRLIPPIPYENPVFRTLLKPLFRLVPFAKPVAGVDIADHKLTHTKLRVYRPQGNPCGAGLFWIHGGGMLIGSISMNDKLCSQYARDLNLTVVSIEYRLAPKYQFPCAIDDCFEGWQWMQSNAQAMGVEPARIVISGQSAGGGLAASLAQRVYDNCTVQPAGQALFCPMLDDRTAGNQSLDIIKHRLWNNKNNRAGWSSYLGRNIGSNKVPNYAVAARRTNLSGLASTWIGVGDIDLFHQESRHYAQRLKAAGVNCEFETVPMAPHGFEAIAPDAEISRSLFESNYRFLRASLAL
jgi:acetyl esterase/lipase